MLVLNIHAIISKMDGEPCKASYFCKKTLTFCQKERENDRGILAIIVSKDIMLENLFSK
jgi:hypothetical protein